MFTYLNYFNVMDMTLIDIFGLLGQVVGGLVLYTCVVNYTLKGMRLVSQQGIVSECILRLCYLVYGVIMAPLLLVAFIVFSLMFPFYLIYKNILVPVSQMFWTYVEMCINYTSIVPDLISNGFDFLFHRLSCISSRMNPNQNNPDEDEPMVPLGPFSQRMSI
jgi:hypothetical protein